jgi:membrane protein implicated in regulation of membrane protease activity
VHSQAAAFDIMKAYAARVAKEALQQFGKRSVGRPTWKVEPLADGRLRVHFGDKTPMMILAEFVEIIFIVAGDGTTLTPWPASPVVSYLRQRLRTL